MVAAAACCCGWEGINDTSSDDPSASHGNVHLNAYQWSAFWEEPDNPCAPHDGRCNSNLNIANTQHSRGSADCYSVC